MLGQQRADEQTYARPTYYFNDGPTYSTLMVKRWPNIVMLSRELQFHIKILIDWIDFYAVSVLFQRCNGNIQKREEIHACGNSICSM